MARSLQLRVADVFLDNENPRHDPIDNELEIIAQLARHERIEPLARDIATQGLSPLDRIAVIPKAGSRGKYVVVEGNRRLCALKLLADPEKAPNARLKAALTKLKSSCKLSPTVDVVSFATRDEARHWLEVRHQGEQQGVGTRKWSSEQKSRFDANGGARANPNLLALQLLDHVERIGAISQEERTQIPLTTITRYLSNPLVRDALGIASRHHLKVTAPDDEFEVAATQFVRDALGEDAAVNSRSDRTAREKYARTLRESGAAVRTKNETAHVPAAAKKPKPRRGEIHPDSRSRVVPSSFRMTASGPVLKRVFEELKTVDPVSHPFAAGYLLRAFLEQVFYQYAKKNGIGANGEFHAVVDKCEKALQEDDSLVTRHGKTALKNILKPLRVMAHEREHRLSPETIGAWVHGNMIPTAGDIKRRWDTLQPSIEIILEKL